MSDDLIAAIDAYAESAYGGDIDGGEIARQRALALDAYAGKNIEPNQDGRSQVIDWTVFETVQWILPSLTRIFASGDDIVEFEPTGPEDEEAADQESQYLNYLVTQKNNWFLTCLQWFQDALITKNAYCMVFMEERLTPEVERYERQSEEQVALLLEDDVEIVGQDIREDTDNPVPVMDELGQPAIDEFGQPVTQPRLLIDIEIKRIKAKKKLQFQVLPPERVKVGEDTPDFTLDECNYFEYFERESISDLRRLGFDVDDDIADDSFHESPEDTARDELLQTEFDRNHPDPSMRQVKVRTIWIRFDEDGDGIAELQKVVRVGSEILLQEPASRIPVASIVPFLNTHRHVGNSVADLVFDIQRIKTALLRGGLDSLYLSLNPERVISDKVNLDDMLKSRPGGIKRLKAGAIPGEGHVQDLVVPFVFPQAQEGMRHMDTVTESRVGVNRMFQGIDDSNLNDHNRVGQLSTMAAQRIEQIARIFGNGVERLFSLAHELVIKSGHQAETTKLRGQWVQIDPSQWRTGRDMRVVAPFAAGNKDALLERLMLFGQIHEKALAGGLSIVDEKNAYNLAKEIAKAADLQPDKLLTDPDTVPPQEPPPDYTMLALELEGKKIEQNAAESELEAELKRYTADLDAQVKEATATQSTELDKYRADLQAETQLLLAKLKAGESVSLEQVKAQMRDAPPKVTEALDKTGASVKALQDALKAANETIEALRADSESEREIVRENGKVVGIKVNGKLRKLKRDKDGKVVGI